MIVTVEEVRQALALRDFRTIGHWYNNARVRVPAHAVLDTEDFCEVIGLDHKTLIAFLTGYDMALTREESAELLGLSARTMKLYRPVLSKGTVARWSFRELSSAIVRRMEKNNEAPQLAPGCHLLPPAKDIPGFDSIIQ